MWYFLNKLIFDFTVFFQQIYQSRKAFLYITFTNRHTALHEAYISFIVPRYPGYSRIVFSDTLPGGGVVLTHILARMGEGTCRLCHIFLPAEKKKFIFDVFLTKLRKLISNVRTDKARRTLHRLMNMARLLHCLKSAKYLSTRVMHWVNSRDLYVHDQQIRSQNHIPFEMKTGRKRNH